MSMKPQPIPEGPPETVRGVRAVFPKGNSYIWLRDPLGTIYQDELVADLYPGRGQPAYAPWRLALVTIFQLMENLTDRQEAFAVRSRLDWKSALSLELTDPGFDHPVTSRVSDSLGGPHRRRALLGSGVDPVQRTGLAQRAGTSTDCFDPCAGEGARHESCRRGGGNTATRAERCWLLSLQSGGFARCSPTGCSDMDIELRNIASLPVRRSVNRSCIRWVRMGGSFWQR